MAAQYITIEAAEALKSALEAVVPAGVAVVADGVADDLTPEGDLFNPPMVYIVISECNPMQYRSVLREYPVEIAVITWDKDDNVQQTLYAASHAVSQWLMEPTALSLTLAHYDALTVEGPPERTKEGALQIMRWTCSLKTRKAV